MQQKCKIKSRARFLTIVRITNLWMTKYITYMFWYNNLSYSNILRYWVFHYICWIEPCVIFIIRQCAHNRNVNTDDVSNLIWYQCVNIDTVLCHYNTVKFVKILTIYTSKLAHEDDVCGCLLLGKIWLMFCLGFCVLYTISWYIGPGYHGTRLYKA